MFFGIKRKECLLKYKAVVQKIRRLPWNSPSVDDLKDLMVLSAYCALEFAESLRITLQEYPESEAFKKMAEGELKTTNLQHDDYTGPGDHAEFLWHFIRKYNPVPKGPYAVDVELAGAQYWRKVRNIDRGTRIMSVVSRERELPAIFALILEAKGWDELPQLQAFRYYLEQHIALDSGEGGHADLLSGFEVGESVEYFYQQRLGMYNYVLFPAG